MANSQDIRYQFVTSIPSPYQLDFFDAFQRAAPGIFEVIFCAASERDRVYYDAPTEFTFPARILGFRPRRFGKDLHNNPSLRGILSKSRARYFVAGGSYFMPDARTVKRHCRRNGRQFVFWGESPFKKREPWPKRFLKERYLSWFLQDTAGVVGIGKAAADDYARLSGGKPTTNIPYSPNLERLAQPPQRLIKHVAALKSRLGTENGLVVLYAGSLIPRKAPDTLLRAFALIAKDVPKAVLAFAGEGPLRDSLEREAQELNVANQVHFLGFLKGDSLRVAYMAADIFALPTRGHEGWGVVVQEAMAAGLPVVVSDRVGAASDLVVHEESGMVFSADSEIDLAKCLLHLAQDDAIRERIGTRGRQLAMTTGAHAAVERFREFTDRL